MKRFIIITVVKLCGEAFLFTILAAIVVGIIGYLRKWESSLEYGNAFFIAGCLVFIAGAFSRLGAGGEWNYLVVLPTESLRDLSASERANYIVNISSSFRLVILCVLSGILLILISLLVPKFF